MRPHLFLATAVLLSASLAARADTITETISATYAGVTSGEQDTGGIIFNPALGTLNAVTQTLTGDLIFVPTLAGAGSYELSTGPLLPNETEYASGDVEFSATGGPAFIGIGPAEQIEALDLSVTGGTVSSVGPVMDTFTFNYTPTTSVTPEPSSFVLLGTGLLGIARTMRRRSV